MLHDDFSMPSLLDARWQKLIAVANEVMALEQQIQENDQEMSELEVAVDEEGPIH